MTDEILGILGGLGPMSGVYFCELLTSHTKAERDQEHLHFLLSSRASTPDRTAHILGQSPQSPLPAMAEEAARLARAGATLLAIPCNTAHYFYEGIAQAVTIPVLNIIRENAAFCRFLGLSKVGVLATEGTVRAGAYRDALTRVGIAYETCSDDEQAIVSEVIYGQIKKGLPPDTHALCRIIDRLAADGCERIILGCTELSLFAKCIAPDARLIDSMEVLGAVAISRCGKEPVGFSPDLLRFAATQSQKRKEHAHAVV